MKVVIHKPPVILEFLATPFVALAKMFGWIASVILPDPIIVMDTNGYITLEGIKDIEELDEETLAEIASYGYPVRVELDEDEDE